MKLDLPHIQHYPIGGENALRVEYNGKVYKVTSFHEFSVEAYSVDSVKSILQPYEYVKPLLHPMSDLYKERNGKIDIVELFRLLCTENDPIDDFKLQVRSDMLVVDCDFKFYYNKNGAFRYHNYRIDGFIPTQLELFQYLFANHYDVFGLIKQGLAIDINTIKE